MKLSILSGEPGAALVRAGLQVAGANMRNSIY